jgi:hypothetical protein
LDGSSFDHVSTTFVVAPSFIRTIRDRAQVVVEEIVVTSSVRPADV